METPSYIAALLQPQPSKPTGRKVWSIDLETVWLPFLTATNVVKATAIPSEALGAPLRLQYEDDGEVKFSKTGRPVVRVAKEIADQVKPKFYSRSFGPDMIWRLRISGRFVHVVPRIVPLGA